METRYAAPYYDFERQLQWTYGDKYYLQASTKKFHEMLDRKHEHSGMKQLNSKQLFDISRRAFEKGELDIAEKYLGKGIRKQKIESAAGERDPEPYYELAVVLQQKASKTAVPLPVKQKLLLQATALYNFVRNCVNKSTVKSEFSTNLLKCLPQTILDVQDSIILAAGGNPSCCKFNSESKKKAMKQLREEAKKELEAINAKYDAETESEEELRKLVIKQTTEIRIFFQKIASRVKQLLIEIIQECVDVLGEPPCDYEVMLLGSVAREEMTPYSDLEWAILTNSEEEHCKIFFRNLTNLVHFQVINLGETILPCMDIEVLRGDWFYDDVTPRGLSFDAFLPQACKTPLGNTLDFELIHNPVTMANFQNNYWYKKDPKLGDILLTVEPLHEDKQGLLNEYKTQVEKILLESCDLDSCAHDVLSTIPTKGVCRGLNVLRKDADRYGETMLENYEAYDGKLYDVKKEIYRLTDRVVAGLSKVFCITSNGSFKILDELYKRHVICSIAKDNLASAVAIALKLRLNTYFLAEKQEEAMKAKSNEATETNNAISAYHIPREKELFHFFFVSTPLYELLCWFCADDKNSSESFLSNSFFDCSEVIKGHINCRILNYVAALDCYKRAHEADPGNIGLQLRQIRIEFILSKGPDVLFLLKSKLDALLQQIRDKPDSDPVLAQEGIASKFNQESRDRVVEVYFLNSQLYLSQGDVNNARIILEQCEKTKSDMSDSYKLMIRLTLMKVSHNQFTHKECDEIISQLTTLLKDEGISVRGLIWLNELGEFLLHQQRYGEAYITLQRALTMGRALFGSNLNFNVVLTLYWLGLACVILMMPEEGQFYFQQILTQIPSLKNQFVVMMLKNVYCQLAMASILTDNYEDAISYFEKALDSSWRKTSANHVIDCIVYCTMATTWSKLDESEKAWKSALDAKDCLTYIVDIRQKVSLTCHLSHTFMKMGMMDEAMLLLKQGLAAEHGDAFKVEYLKSLGQLCTKQDLMEDAERYYNNALEILRFKNVNTLDIVSTLVDISKVLMKTKKSSEAVSYLSDATKYASTMMDNENKCKYLKKIAECWEELGDYYNARKCLEQAIKVCALTAGNPKVVPVDEFDLNVKLGDVVEKILTSSSYNVGGSSIPEKNEHIKTAQRLHYDRAGIALRQHLATGFFTSTTIQMFVLLAGKYRSIDLLEEEKLLLEALKMSEEIYGPDNTNELVASVLTDLVDLYLSKKDYESATDFFDRSLGMEMEIHSSDPYHHHIRYQILLLNELYYGYPQSQQLKTTMQKVLIFLEQRSEDEAFINSVEKANCFTSIAPLCFCSGDFEKAEKFNRIASDIFSTLEPGETCQTALLDKASSDMMSMLFNIVKGMPAQDIPNLRKSLVMFREIFRSRLERRDVHNSAGSSNAQSSLSRNESSAVASFDNQTVLRNRSLSENSVLMNESSANSSNKISRSSKTVELDSVSTVNSSFQNASINTDVMNEKKLLPCPHIVFRQEKDDDVRNDVQNSQLYQYSPALPKVQNGSSKELTVSDNSGFSHIKPSNGTDKRQNVNTLHQNWEEDGDVYSSKVHKKDNLDHNKKSMLFKKVKSDCENIDAVVDSILYENRQGDAGLGFKTAQTSLSPLLVSLYEKLYSDPVQSLIHEAEQAKNGKNIFRMISSIDIASKFPSDSETKAKLFKLTGQYQLYMQNCRTAAINFDKAISFYRSVRTALEPKHYVEYVESLIGLTKSHLLCNDEKNALCICQEGVALISSIQPQPTTSRLLVELFYLGAKCTLQLSTHFTHEKDLEQVISFCQQALQTSEDVDRHSGSNDLAEELGSERGEFFALKCEVRLLMASTLFRQKNLEEARKIVKELRDFLQNIDAVLEMFSEDMWPNGIDDFSTIQRRMFSWIGRALVMSDDTDDALIYLQKSLAIFFASASPGAMFPVEEIIALLDAITVTTTITSPEQSDSAFQHTLEVCKRQFLELKEKLKEFWDFLAAVGNHYVSADRTQESILIYEAALAIAECMECDDQNETRSQTLLYLANAHRLQAIKKGGKGVLEENHLAEKYYQTENGSGTENSSIFKNIMYAEFLWDKCRFEEAIIVLKRATDVGDTLWSKKVICSYSKRVLFGLDVQRYIESHGEVVAIMGNLAYSSLVRTYVKLGDKKEAIEAYDKLSTNGKDMPSGFGVVTLSLPYLLTVCEKNLMSLIEEPRKLSFDESDFPLSATNLAKLYFELGEYKMTLKSCQKARMSTESTSNEETKFFEKLSTEYLAANASVMSVGNYTWQHFYSYERFLEMLQEKEKILNKSFVEQKAILSQYSFPEPYYVYRLLGMMLDEKRIDGRIACYEHCLRLQPGYDIEQSLVGTLAELYQTKAFTEGKDDKGTHEWWMEKAQGCFQKLLDKNLKMEPFVESTYASFLYRTKRFDEAISHFEQLIGSEIDNKTITHSGVDKPFSGVYLAREIEARGTVSLPLKIFVYYHMVLAYLECDKVEKARESALQMEEYVKNFTSNPDYSIIHSFLAYTYKKIGNESKASEIFQAVLNREPDNEPVKLALKE